MSGRPLLMGIVNVTPDSFSDGGRFLETDAAIERGRQLVRDGADILDIGGESTRPGATRPLVEEELGRVIPVITALAAEGARVSVDTMRSEVASAAIAAGAQLVNDVSGGLADPRILAVTADSEASYICMHWRAHATSMQDETYTTYDGGVVAGVTRELGERLHAARAAGIGSNRLIADPGLGFSKTMEQNWELLRAVGPGGAFDPTGAIGVPVLIGASRKGFLGHLLAGPHGQMRPIAERESAHTALVALLAQRGVWGLRVHDVRAAHDALLTTEKLPLAVRADTATGMMEA